MLCVRVNFKMAQKITGVKRKRCPPVTGPPVIPSHLSQMSAAGLAGAIAVYDAIQADTRLLNEGKLTDEKREVTIKAAIDVDLGTVVDGHTLLYHIIESACYGGIMQRLPRAKLTRHALLYQRDGHQCALVRALDFSAPTVQWVVFADAVTVEDLMTVQTASGSILNRLMGAVYHLSQDADRSKTNAVGQVAAELAARLPSSAFTPDVINTAVSTGRVAALNVIVSRLPDVDIFSCSLPDVKDFDADVALPSRESTLRVMQTAREWMAMYFEQLPAHVQWYAGLLSELTALVVAYLSPSSSPAPSSK